MKETYQMHQDELLKQMQAQPGGLSSEEAARRLQEYGENALEEQARKKGYQVFLEQFADLLVLILIPAGIYFTIRTRALPVRLFPEMLRVTAEKKNTSQEGAISGVQALIVSTATRVGMGNLVGVVAAISAGGAGAVFWMWVTALAGSSTEPPLVTRGMTTDTTMITAAMMTARETMIPARRRGEGPRP